MKHIPVMLTEVIEWLRPESGKAYIDGTLGLGGHMSALMEVMGEGREFHGVERDRHTLEVTQASLSSRKDFIAHHARFSQIPNLIQLSQPLGGILLDLGISSLQLSDPRYGLSFMQSMQDQPLDMRLDRWCQKTAADILNKYKESDLADLFWDLADYPSARPLARAIVQSRPLHTIGDLVKVCERFRPPHSKIHPATLPFMALRIAVNEEFEELAKALPILIDWMEPGSKLVVISFHSGEDRIVKQCFKSAEGLKVLTPKPLIPSSHEIKSNPRARSAKMRVGEKL